MTSSKKTHGLFLDGRSVLWIKPDHWSLKMAAARFPAIILHGCQNIGNPKELANATAVTQVAQVPGQPAPASLVQPLPLPPETVPGSNTEQKPPCLRPLMWGRLPWGSGQTSPGYLCPPLLPSSKLPCSCLLLLSTSDSMSTCQPHFTDSCCCSPRKAT